MYESPDLSGSLRRLKSFGFEPRTVVDIGAYEGAFSRLCRDIFPNAYVVMIEPLAEKVATLQKVSREIGNASFYQLLLGEVSSPDIPFYVVNSAHHPDVDLSGSSKYLENSVYKHISRRLPQTTLDVLLNSTSIDVDLIKLDVQGGEVDVLRGGIKALETVEVLIVELSLVDYNQGAAEISIVMTELDRLGFCLFDVAGQHRWSGHLYQLDGVFVPKQSKLRARPPFHYNTECPP